MLQSGLAGGNKFPFFFDWWLNGRQCLPLTRSVSFVCAILADFSRAAAEYCGRGCKSPELNAFDVEKQRRQDAHPPLRGQEIVFARIPGDLYPPLQYLVAAAKIGDSCYSNIHHAGNSYGICAANPGGNSGWRKVPDFSDFFEQKNLHARKT
jgi:hypothetical protein